MLVELYGGLRSALWRAGDIPRIYPTSGVASARICLAPQVKDAPGFTAYGRSSMPFFTCAQERLPMAVAPEGLPAMEECLRPVQAVAHRRDLRAPENAELRERLRAAPLGRNPQPSAGT
jgi:hypothetical protein